jgi:hypothetical protein
VLDSATVVIRNGVITAVGKNLRPPAGARVWDLKGQTIYPGFIDAHADLGMDAVPQGGDVGPTHWNPQVRAWFSTTVQRMKDDTTRRVALRSLGFGTALAVPKQGIFRGTASVVNLGDAGVRERVLRADLLQAIGFQRSFQLGGMYPNSAMGTDRPHASRRSWTPSGTSARGPRMKRAAARCCRRSGAKHSGRSPSRGAGQAAGALPDESEEEYLRAYTLAKDYKLVPWFRGNGMEYRLIDVLKGRTQPLIVPLNFPDAPTSRAPSWRSTPRSRRSAALVPRADQSGAALAAAGVPFALTTDGFSRSRSSSPISAPPSRAVSPLTRRSPHSPRCRRRGSASSKTHGTIAVGKVANLVVTDGDLFTEDAGHARRVGAGHALRRDPSAAGRSARHVGDHL